MKALLTPNAPRVIAWALGVVALVSPVLLVTQSSSGKTDLLAVLLWLLIPNAIAGFVLSWRWSDMPDPLSPASSAASLRWTSMAIRGLLDGVVVLVIQFVGTFVIQFVVSVTQNDWRELIEGPLLIAACGGMALFLAVVVGFLIVGPLRTLGRALAVKLSGGHEDSARPAFAVLLLLIVAFGVAATCAGFTVPHGERRSVLAGVVLLGELLFTVHGTPEQQVFAWVARLLVALLVVTVVWLWKIARRRRSASAS